MRRLNRILAIAAGLVFSITPVRLASANPASTIPATAAPSYGADWGTSRESALQNFASWAEAHTLGSATGTDLSEGVALAQQRRAVLLDMIKTNPARAIALAVPSSVRAQLPKEVTDQLETIVSGIGDYTVSAELQAHAGPPVTALSRSVEIGNQTYKAYVYGRRLHETTKKQIPLHGLVLDGLMAVHADALRILSPVELTKASQPARLGSASQTANGPLGQVGGLVYQFTSEGQVRETERRLEAAESKIGPQPVQSSTEILQEMRGSTPSAEEGVGNPSSAYTQGNKSVLVIRVDFSDRQGVPYGPNDTSPITTNVSYTADYVQNLMDTVIAPYYQVSSYAKTSLTTTVTMAVYRMPQTANYYATNGANTQLHTDAENAASASYPVASYDRVVVLFAYLGNIPGSQITYGGRANIGGPSVWLNGECDFRVTAHELGHTYGLYHGDLWQVSDGNPISPSGTSTDYGDPFDTMGANTPNDHGADFNPWFKTLLGWLSPLTVTSSGTYRVNRFDTASPSGNLALLVHKDGTRDYWISVRRNFTSNSSLAHGAYIIWGYTSNQPSNLLDMTSPGYNQDDDALAVGSTFTDNTANLSIQPLDEGGSGTGQYLDVQVTFGLTQPGTLQLSGRNTSVPALAGSASFTVSNTGGGTLNWSASSSDSWLTVNTPSGSDAAGAQTTLSYSYTQNNSDTRAGIITVTAPGAYNSPQTFTVAQADHAQGPILKLYPTSALIDPVMAPSLSSNISNGGSGILNWTAYTTDNWITVETPSGSNPPGFYKSLECSVQRNDSTLSRTGSVTITAPGAGSGSPQVFTITQSGRSPVPVLNLDSSYGYVAATGSSGSFLVSNLGSGTLNWSASSTVSWITVNSATGSDGPDVQSAIYYSVQKNDSPVGRTGTITVSDPAASNNPQVYLIQQAGRPLVPAHFGNISTRLNVGTGDNVAIAGFIINGTALKKVLIRATGPSLNNAGVPIPGRMDDPTLELHDGNGTVVSYNDNWITSPDAEAITDSTLAPSDPRESAIVKILYPGTYTAILRGANDSTGVGLIEVYDLDPSANSELANISTRGLVQTGDNVMIGGLIASGERATHMVVRALGPSLSVNGVPLPGRLADPTLELYDSQGNVYSNDNWTDPGGPYVQYYGLQPSDPLESALFVNLVPGNYTFIVRGKNGAIGIASVEAYHLSF